MACISTRSATPRATPHSLRRQNVCRVKYTPTAVDDAHWTSTTNTENAQQGWGRLRRSQQLAESGHAGAPHLHGAEWRRTLRAGKGAQGMCSTCGCKRPYDEMGDPKNITESSFEEAGQTAAIGKAGTVEAKRHMLELLQLELERTELDKPKEQY
jgi:hypothetical protein